MTTESNVCAVSVTNLSHASSVATITASAANYQSVTSQITIPTQYIFITVNDYRGNLGRESGADQKCQIEAELAGLFGDYAALLVTESRYPCGTGGLCAGNHASVDWPLTSGDIYYNPSGSIFNTVNVNAVFDGSESRIEFSDGSPTDGFDFWSGIQSVLTSSDGLDIVGWAYIDENPTQDNSVYADNLANCNNFTSSESTENGAFGVTNTSTYVEDGTVPANTWGNYFYFSNTNSAYNINVWSIGFFHECNSSARLVCVSH